MPYRIDVRGPAGYADRLIELGALDVDEPEHGTVAAVMPDDVTPDQVRHALKIERITISPAPGRDADSVWILRPRPVRIGRVHIFPAGTDAPPDALALIDAPAFGTGLHTTTALCLEVLDEILQTTIPADVLDVGTGSGVLALAAVRLGARRAVGIDIDRASLDAAAENARINRAADRLQLVQGSPACLRGRWPLIVANILAGPLVEIAPQLVRCVGHHGLLVLSGIRFTAADDIASAYGHLGMHLADTRARDGWCALTLRAPW